MKSIAVVVQFTPVGMHAYVRDLSLRVVLRSQAKTKTVRRALRVVQMSDR